MASVAGLLRRGLEQLREDLKHKEKELRQGRLAISNPTRLV